MSRKIFGTVTEEEKNTIEKLFERKNALKELLLTLNNPSLSEKDKDFLYEKIISDTAKTEGAFQKWWSDMVQKYKWQPAESGMWNIDFKTNEIFG
jgi:CXXX repeat modification system protein